MLYSVPKKACLERMVLRTSNFIELRHLNLGANADKIITNTNLSATEVSKIISDRFRL